MIDKPLLKIICICSAILGAILGVVSLIPAISWIAILLVMFGIAPFMILYLKQLKVINEIEIEKSMVMGAMAGASSFIGFSVTYFPIAFILYLIFKIQAFLAIKVMFVNFGFLVPMIILTALLCALVNAFSGFLTAYIYLYFRPKKRG